MPEADISLKPSFAQKVNGAQQARQNTEYQSHFAFNVFRADISESPSRTNHVVGRTI